jgi:hypothetical protein
MGWLIAQSPGHLRRLDPELERRGLARKVRGGGREPRWEVRTDVSLEAVEAEEVPAFRGRYIVLRVGGTSIQIGAESPVTLRITPAARGGGKRSQRASEGRSIDVR